MSLPPGFLDELRNRTSLSDVVGRKVVWDSRKSQPGKGDMWAPCPFHQEKTASFHVDDKKGFYYCFGCHAKGNAFNFIMETENVPFMEAVEILAREAGMQMPARDPRAQQKADRHAQLVDVVEEATQFFRLQLKTGAGSDARAYLTRRGLSEAALDRWEIGFAPDAWQGLWDHLTGKGIAADLILEAGLAKPSQKKDRPYDTFRNRIMFPIRDSRGRGMAFGGRAMDPGDNAKYLNSPETPLFDKSRVLFNHGPARAASGKGQPLIVAEGYMDVIALSEAGFAASVAPLGTAVTEHHLQLLWRMSDEPIIALDGDTAGLRAAMRTVDLALPLLQAGKSLRFAIMPDGQDPDDLLRAKGPDAVRAVLEAAQPLVDLLWRRETEGKSFDSPERKAALDKALADKTRLIQDPGLRGHYDQALRDLKWQLFRARPKSGAQQGKTPWRRGAMPSLPTASTKTSPHVTGGPELEAEFHQRAVLAAALVTPDVVIEFEHRIASMRCTDPDMDRLRALILTHAITDPDNLRDIVVNDLGQGALEKLLSHRHVAISPAMRRPGDLDIARMTLSEELAKLDAQAGLKTEMAEAVEDLSDLPDETLSWRLNEAAEAANNARRSQHEDKAVYDTAENGLRINRAERAALDALLSRIRGDKPSG
ncbi:MAG: DNA primase [Rhodobacteraceae bacterium]|nr:DNA primase [Paracoccaceae bacterium]